MSILEIISGVLLILSCLVLIVIVLRQEAKGQGLSSVITGGGADMMGGEGRSRSKEARQVRMTQIATVILFVVTVAVNFISALSN